MLKIAAPWGWANTSRERMSEAARQSVDVDVDVGVDFEAVWELSAVVLSRVVESAKR